MAGDAVVRVVINAIDQASGVLKSISSPLTSLADGLLAAQDGISNYFDSGIFKLAKLGGAFAEQSSQFRAYAEATGKSADGLLSSIDDIADGTLKIGERMTIASKAISTGLSNSDIDAALRYTKKWTESTGQDFNDWALKVTEAFSTGRYGVVKQMGLFAEKGMAASDIVAQMRDGIGQFGDAAFNSGDAIEAIVADVSDFVTYVGEAINSSATFQATMEFLADVVDKFAKGFDYKFISTFFETLVEAGRVSLDALLEMFGTSIDGIYQSFRALSDKGGVGSIFAALIDYAKEGAKWFVRFSSTLVEEFALIGDGFGLVVKYIGEGLGSIKWAASGVVESVSSVLSSLLAVYNDTINGFVAANPELASKFGGLDTMLNMSAKAQSALYGIAIASRAAKENALSGNDIFGDLVNVGDKIRETFDMQGTFDELEQFAAKAQSAIDTVSVGKLDATKKRDTSAAIEAARKLKELRDGAAQAKEDEAEEKRTKKIEAELKKQNAEYEKAQKEKKDMLEKSLRDIEAIEKRTAGKGVTFGLLTVDETELLKNKQKIKDALKAITDAEASERAKYIKGLLGDKNDFKQFGKDIAEALGPAADALRGGTSKIDVSHKVEEAKYSVRIEDNPNWPGALNELVQLVIKAVVAQFRAGRIPIAITGTPA